MDAAQAAAKSSEQLLQFGAIGAMLLIAVIALAWVFRRMDTRLEETQKSADTDRKEYMKNMQDLATSTGAHIAKSTEVLEKVSENQTKCNEMQTQILARLGSGHHGALR